MFLSCLMFVDAQMTTGSIMDYGSLMTVALQRSQSARELIKTMDQLVQVFSFTFALRIASFFVLTHMSR